MPPVVHPFDRAHGTDTSGLLPAAWLARGTGARLGDLTAYYGVAPSILSGTLDLWLRQLAPQSSLMETVFLDVGAGKGRALLLASRYPFLRVEGVELNPALVQIAEANIERWTADETSERLAPIVLHEGDATRLPLPSEPTLACLFHPFERPVLRRFLQHVERSTTAAPRPFDLLYINAEHGSFLDGHPAFDRLWMGRIAMSPEDHVADLAEIATQQEYGSTGDELCAFYRFHSRKRIGRADVHNKDRRDGS